MTKTEAYTGGCHCGKVRYEVKADLSQTITCNCSFCAKSGAILTFVPADDFKLVSGADSLSDYQFNKKIIHHHFCKACGIRSFARATKPDGTDGIAVNVRCLDNVDSSTLNPHPYDGRNI